MIKKALCAYGKYLDSPHSANVLGDGPGDWFSPPALRSLIATANAGKTDRTFEDLYDCDPTRPLYGFTSWDAFFTRTFRDGVRPVACLSDDNIIPNACGSVAHHLVRDAAAQEKFWIKGQRYSVRDMLAYDPLHESFIGGTVYQAFLSAQCYHRWHSPVSGTIKKAYGENGTYYSAPPFAGMADPTTRPNADGESMASFTLAAGQAYVAHVATRAIIFPEADNTAIGLMAFIGVGMVEVSTCETTVKEGQRIKKGDQLGMFLYGGSTHCLFFGRDVDVEGFPAVGGDAVVPVKSQIAYVVPY